MRFTVPFQNFYLPLLGGAIVAIPTLYLDGRPAGAVRTPAAALAPSLQLGCGPFVESFAAMRAEAERIALLASTAATPAEEDGAAAPAPVETWREIAAAARALDDWMWEAGAPGAPLSPREAAAVSVTTRMTRDMRVESAAVAGDLVAMASELDMALPIGRMRAVERAAVTVARRLAPLAICESPRELSYAPADADCESVDAEYQYAMTGPCQY